LTPTQLERVGIALYGARWQTDLARDLAVADRSVRRWASGQNPIPASLVGELLVLVEQRAVDLAGVADMLKSALASTSAE